MARGDSTAPTYREGSGGTTEVFLPPGGFHFGSGQQRISTLLGSCVAITFWHRRRNIGGMCHYLLPGRTPMGGDRGELDGRYADEAMLLFQDQIDAAATKVGEYDVKMFGGGNQFSHQHGASSIDVPGRNIDVGLDLLADMGAEVSARHLGGVGARQVILDLVSGEVWVKHVSALEKTVG